VVPVSGACVMGIAVEFMTLNVPFLLLLTGFEIPDCDTDRLNTPADIVQYIADKRDVYDEH